MSPEGTEIEHLKKKIAICLLSGGIDSTVAAFHIKSLGYDIFTLTVDYGQKARAKELSRAAKIADLLDAKEHKVVIMPDFRNLSISPITGYEILEKAKAKDQGDIPETYPPGRDILLLTLASTWAESIWLNNVQNIDEIKVIIGTNHHDSKKFPDCRSDAYDKINDLLKSSTKISTQFSKEIRIEAPFIDKTKAYIIRLGLTLGVPLDITWSCYNDLEKPCGKCSGCQQRLKTFKKVGIENSTDDVVN